jgi:hypothetical protein
MPGTEQPAETRAEATARIHAELKAAEARLDEQTRAASTREHR